MSAILATSFILAKLQLIILNLVEDFLFTSSNKKIIKNEVEKTN